jgi:hypothetical protein
LTAGGPPRLKIGYRLRPLSMIVCKNVRKGMQGGPTGGTTEAEAEEAGDLRGD